MSIVNSISIALDKLKSVMDDTSVIGEKMVIGDMTIIPISKIDIGFAGGGTDIIDKRQQKSNQPLGTGAKMTVTPLSFLVIDKDGAHLLNIAEKASVPEQIVSAVIDKLKSIKSEKEYIVEE